MWGLERISDNYHEIKSNIDSIISAEAKKKYNKSNNTECKIM